MHPAAIPPEEADEEDPPRVLCPRGGVSMSTKAGVLLFDLYLDAFDLGRATDPAAIGDLYSYAAQSQYLLASYIATLEDKCRITRSHYQRF